MHASSNRSTETNNGFESASVLSEPKMAVRRAASHADTDVHSDTLELDVRLVSSSVKIETAISKTGMQPGASGSSLGDYRNSSSGVGTPTTERARAALLPNSPLTGTQPGTPLIPQSNSNTPTYRCVPSWLSSLILHMTLILLLALFTIKNGGKSILELAASTTASTNIDIVSPVNFDLEPVELGAGLPEYESEQPELSPVQDTASLFEAISFADDLSLSSDSQQGIPSHLHTEKLAGDSGGAQFFGVKSVGSRFVYIVDCSGSMSEYGRWRLAVRELQDSIRKLDNNQRFVVLLYSSGVSALGSNPKLVPASDRETKKAFRWLSKNYPGGWTFCASAISTALLLEPDAIFLLSDGEFNDRDEVFQVLKTMNPRHSGADQSQIPIHTIALGSHQGRFTMKRIADENQGDFRLVE